MLEIRKVTQLECFEVFMSASSICLCFVVTAISAVFMMCVLRKLAMINWMNARYNEKCVSPCSAVDSALDF